MPARLLNQSLASKSVLRMNSYAEPWNWFVPDFATNIITPPPAWPYSALNPLVSTVNCVMASTDGAFEVTQFFCSAREVSIETPSSVA